jgi:hypothetical protein
MNSINGRPIEWGLPAGTRVQLRSRTQPTGTVMPYEPAYSHGLFPVRLDNGIWLKCDPSDVIVLDTTERIRSVALPDWERR